MDVEHARRTQHRPRTAAEMRQAITAMAAVGLGPYEIAQATGASVEEVRAAPGASSTIPFPQRRRGRHGDDPMTVESAAFNLTELKRYKAIKVELVGGALRLIFEPIKGERGVMTGFAPPPRTVESDRFEPSTEHLSASERMFLTSDPSYLAAARVLNTLDQWGATVAAAANNTGLSGDGRGAVYVQAATTAVTAVGAQYAALERIAADLATQHAALFAVPAADTAATVVDVELRGVYRAMEYSARVAMFTAFDKNERLMLALLRSPIALPDVEAKALDKAWAESVAAENPEEAASLALAEDANAWATGLTKWVGGLLVNPSTNGTTGLIDAFALYKTLRSGNAVGLLGYSPAQIAMWERRIASIAA
jgi:hypothetical protein